MDAAPLYQRGDARTGSVTSGADCLHLCGNSEGPLGFVGRLLYAHIAELDRKAGA